MTKRKQQTRPQIPNRTIFCRNNIDVLQGINSGSVDLIYLDPPFNKKKVFTAPIGSSAEGASFKDIFTRDDLRDEWLETIKEDQEKIHSFLNGIQGIEGRRSYNFCYLAYMAIRIIECHRLLKNTGSLYLHCDSTMAHYLKILLDCVFGEKNFVNEISWERGTASGGKATAKKFIPQHDTIFSYAKSHTFQFQMIYTPYTEDYIKERFRKKDHIGLYREQLGGRKQYLQDSKGKPTSDFWYDIYPVNPASKERTGYPTQKPLALLERIIQASSKEGDLVLDPFCGCATTCVAAEKLGRRWIGVDISTLAGVLVRERLKKELWYEDETTKQRDIYSLLKELPPTQITPPKRTDTGKDYRGQKYVYIISNTAYKDEYKVGIASNYQKRLDSYQTSDPNRGYKLEYKLLTPRFRAIEKHIHTTFESRHEWVKGDISKIKKAMLNYDKGGSQK